MDHNDRLNKYYSEMEHKLTVPTVTYARKF